MVNTSYSRCWHLTASFNKIPDGNILMIGLDEILRQIIADQTQRLTRAEAR